MSQPSAITDDATGISAKVTSRGELITAKISHSSSYQASRTTAGTSTVVAGKAGKLFVMTSILATQDKTNLDTHITVFESSDLDSATKNVIILETDFLRNSVLVATGLDIVTQPVQWINFTTDVATGISVTIAGYYIDE